MKKKIRLLLLINWEEKGRWYFYRRISECFNKVHLLQPWLYNVVPHAFWQHTTLWLSEFYLPLCALLQRSSYNLLVSWSMRIGIWYGILNRILRSPRAPRHIIYDFHINPNRTDFAYRFRLLLLRAAVPGIDFFLCTSHWEAQRYSNLFKIPRDRITFFPMAPPPHFFEAQVRPCKDYILAYGNSDRDYDTLVSAIDGLSARLIILSQRYQPRAPLPPNVSLVTKKIVGQDLIDLITAAQFVVLPLKHAEVSAGQTAMLEVMALGKPLIVTENSATREYALHNESALFFEAGRKDQLREHIHFLLHNPSFAEKLGATAREASRGYPEQQVSSFCSVVEKLVP